MEPGKGTHIDHDHTTGDVRALLCLLCNAMIGFARESAATLTAAAKYVGGI